MFAFYDAGRVTNSSKEWLSGVGAGFGIAGVRVEFGFRTDDIPQSRQILLRIAPTV